jgi:hypothetical protein
MADRQPWTFAQNLKPEFREPRAQEYIAYYLDRIDQTLERIAKALEAGGGNEPLRLGLMNLEQTVRKSYERG